MDEMLAQCGARVLQPGDSLDMGELQQNQMKEEAQARAMRQGQEAENLEKTRAKLLEEGGAEKVVERAEAVKAQATACLAERPQQSLGLYLLGVWFCKGGPFPTSIAPSAPMPKGRVVADAARGDAAEGVDPQLLLSLQSNVSLCCLKLGDFLGAALTAEAILSSPACDEAMTNKARLRLATARRENGDYAEAEKVLKLVLKQDEKLGHKIAARELELIKRLKAADKKRFSGLFDRGGEDLYGKDELKERRKEARARVATGRFLVSHLSREAPVISLESARCPHSERGATR